MQFDEQFLEEMGLATMPEERKGAFLAYLQEELEVQIVDRTIEEMKREIRDNRGNLLGNEADSETEQNGETTEANGAATGAADNKTEPAD